MYKDDCVTLEDTGDIANGDEKPGADGVVDSSSDSTFWLDSGIVAVNAANRTCGLVSKPGFRFDPRCPLPDDCGDGV